MSEYRCKNCDYVQTFAFDSDTFAQIFPKYIREELVYPEKEEGAKEKKGEPTKSTKILCPSCKSLILEK